MDTFDELIADLGSGSDEERSDAAEELGAIGDVRAVEPLINVLRSTQSDMVRHYAALALGEIGDPEAIEPLIQVMKATWNNGGMIFALWNFDASDYFFDFISVLEGGTYETVAMIYISFKEMADHLSDPVKEQGRSVVREIQSREQVEWRGELFDGIISVLE